MTEDTDRHAERLLRQREAVAKEFGIEDINDWRVKRLALLMAAHAAYEDRMATSGAVDIAPLLALDETIQVVRQQLRAEEPNISVHIVEGVTGIYCCTKCGHKNELKQGEYEPRKKQTPPPAPPVAVNARPIDEAEAKPKPKPAPQHTNNSVSAFHNQAGAPLKRLQADVRAMRSVSPLSNGKG